METLANSSSKLLSRNYGEKTPRFSCPKDFHSRLYSPKLFSVRFSHSISLQRHNRLVRPICASSSPSSEPQTQVKDDETQIEGQSKTVHVKLQLQRECSFGERFHIVGDDPSLGLWDPSSAMPMNWSDGHIWTVELDLPIGKPIQFKFILVGNTGDILWQPGPDRILQTWETNDTISVSEDWDDAELQKVIEEKLVLGQNKFIANVELLSAEENLTEPSGGPEVELVSNEPTTTDGITNPTENTLPGSNVNGAVSVGDIITGAKGTLGDIGYASTLKNSASMKDGPSTDSYEGVPVLVPGLTPLQTVDTEEATQIEDEENIVAAADPSLGLGKTKEHDVPEEEPVDDSPSLKKTFAVVMLSDEKEVNGSEREGKSQLVRIQDQVNSVPSKVLENDMQWGRRTLQKLLTSWGLL